jgi:hypothetical protein
MNNNPEDTILVRPIGKLSDGNAYVFFGTITIILTAMAMILTFTSPSWKVGNETVLSPLAISILEYMGLFILFVILCVLIILLYVPSMSSILKLIDKIKGALFLFIFIFALIVFYRNIASQAISHYRWIVCPIILFITIKLFAYAMEPSPEEKYIPNIQIEKIRFSLVYTAFLALVLVLYSVDFGGFLKEYLGSGIMITFVLLAMGLVYVLTLLSYPIIKTETGETNISGVLSGWTLFGSLHALFFVGTIIAIIIGFIINLDYFKDSSKQISFKNTRFSQFFGVSISLLILWIGYFSVRMFSDKKRDINGEEKGRLKKIALIVQNVLLLMGGTGFLVSLVYWIIYMANMFTKTHDVFALILNIILVVFVMIIVVKYLANTTHFQRSPYFRLIVNVVFYIPCLIYDVISGVLSMIGISLPSLRNVSEGIQGATGPINSPSWKDVKALSGIITIYILYFIIVPYIRNKVSKQGGNLVLQNPKSISNEISLGTYTKLNGIGDEVAKTLENQSGVFNYTFAISFWLMLDSDAMTSNKYYTIMNYNEIPHIMWNPKKATMIFTIKDTRPTKKNKNNLTHPEEIAENGNLIIYTLSTLPMQKWNNIIFNYLNGTVDIFVNNKLASSTIDIVPEMGYGELKVGSSKLTGKICNVVYFNRVLEMKNIHYLYNLVKNRNPPVATQSEYGTKSDTLSNTTKMSTYNYIIPINIETNIWDDIKQDSEDVAKKINPYIQDNNYLSLGWYFRQNGDTYNNASGTDGNVPSTPDVTIQSSQTTPPSNSLTK